MKNSGYFSPMSFNNSNTQNEEIATERWDGSNWNMVQPTI